MAIAHRLANTGTLLTNTYFDEVSQFGSGSLYFNGSSYLQSNNSVVAFGTKDFTIDYWLYPTNIQAVVASQLSSGNTASANSWQLGINSTLGTMSFAYSGSTSLNGTTVLQTRRWYHVAITRNTGTIRLFLNGLQENSIAYSGDYLDYSLKIGNSRTVGNLFSGGNLSNIRLINGTALYTSNFARPEISSTNVSNTALLMPTFNYNPFLDYTNNKITFTNFGSTSNTLTPFANTARLTSNNIIGKLDEVTNKPITVFITTTGSSTFTIPSNFGSLVSIEAIGASPRSNTSFSGSGTGGGAYSKITSLSGLSAGGTAYVFVGPSASIVQDSWFNVSSNTAPSNVTQGVLAKGGGIATGAIGGGQGGQESSGVGTTKFSGGNGNYQLGGGGGAAGPGGKGGDGLNGGGGAASRNFPGNAGKGETDYGPFGSIVYGDGGNGGDYGTNTLSNISFGDGATYVNSNGFVFNGTPGVARTGGGGGSGSPVFNGQNGATGSFWTQTSNGQTAGSGGGGGGGYSSNLGGTGGLYGGGAGGSFGSSVSGGQGIIVFTYNPNTNNVLSISNNGTLLINNEGGIFNEYTGIQ